MKKIFVSCLLLLIVSALSGCGGGGSGGADSQATVNLSASKSKALANGTDGVTIQADVRNVDGTPVADGTVIAFSISDAAATLSAPAAVTIGGLASVTVTCAGIQTITVTGAVGGASGAVAVKFISQPTSADIAISLNQPVQNLAVLRFNLKNSPGGVTFDNGAQLIAAINNASDPQTLVAGNFSAAENSNAIGLINGNTGGFFTGTLPIIKVTISIDPVSVLPFFSIDMTPENFMAADANGGPTVPQVTAANLVVTATYDSEL